MASPRANPARCGRGLRPAIPGAAAQTGLSGGAGRLPGEGGKRRGEPRDRRLHGGAEPVARGDPSGIVVAQADGAALVLPDQRLQRQVDAGGLCRLHQRRTAFGIAEHHERGRA